MDHEQIAVREFEADDFQWDAVIVGSKEYDSIRTRGICVIERAPAMLDDPLRPIAPDGVSFGRSVKADGHIISVLCPTQAHWST